MLVFRKLYFSRGCLGNLIELGRWVDGTFTLNLYIDPLSVLFYYCYLMDLCKFLEIKVFLDSSFSSYIVNVGCFIL